MNLPTKQLKQIIKEELNKLLKESQEGGFDSDKEIPDAAPEGFEKTYDSALATMRKETDECSELLEKVIGLCTATTLSINDKGDYKVRVINFNHPSIHYYAGQTSGHPSTYETQKEISEELYKILLHKRAAAMKCYWYPIVNKVRKEVYGDKDLSYGVYYSYFVKVYGSFQKDEYFENFYTFTTSLANELRKVQRGEHEDPATGGDTE